MRLLLAAFFWTAMSSFCLAQQTPTRGRSPTVAPIIDTSIWPGDISDPVWLHLPRENDFVRLYPREALREGRSARIYLYCRVMPDGYLLCSMSGDSDFLEATDALLPHYRMAPSGANGALTMGRTVHMSVVWRHPSLPPGAEPALDSAALDLPIPPPAPPAPRGLISNPQWIERPQAQDFARLYPRAAWSAGVSGRVILDCTARRNGRLDCSIGSENPPGYGFGEASLALARGFKIMPRPADGTRTEGGRLRIPITWRISD